jgi:hypothetical protein
MLLELLPPPERRAPLRERRVLLELRDQSIARCTQRVSEPRHATHARKAVRSRQLERAAQGIDAAAQISVHALTLASAPDVLARLASRCGT